MDPVTAGLLIAGAGKLLGGIFGAKKPKPLTAAQLEALFGPGVLAREAQELYQRIATSPAGQQMLTSASEQSQAFQSEMNRRAAASGLSPDTGGQSATSDFVTSAAASSRAGFERDVRADMWKNAMAQAQQNLSMRAGLFSQQQSFGQSPNPNWADALGGAAQGVGEGLAMAGPKAATTTGPAEAYRDPGFAPLPEPRKAAGASSIFADQDLARARTRRSALVGSRNVMPVRSDF